MEYLDKGGPAMATRNKISNPVNGPGYRVAGRLVHPSKATTRRCVRSAPGRPSAASGRQYVRARDRSARADEEPSRTALLLWLNLHPISENPRYPSGRTERR